MEYFIIECRFSCKYKQYSLSYQIESNAEVEPLIRLTLKVWSHVIIITLIVI